MFFSSFQFLDPLWPLRKYEFVLNQFQRINLSELRDMMFCQRHACRSGPTEVAHFDFQLSDACVGASRDTVSFSGTVEMCVLRGKSMLLTYFDLYPVHFLAVFQNFVNFCSQKAQS